MGSLEGIYRGTFKGILKVTIKGIIGFRVLRFRVSGRFGV